jgi:hypothetical protein
MTATPGLLYFASAYWDDPLLNPQQIAKRLAGHFPLLYVEPSPAALYLREPGRNRRWLRAGRLEEVAPWLHVYSPPPMLPFKTRVPVFNRLSQAWIRPFVRRAMHAVGIEAPVLFTFLPHLHASVGCYGERLVCYYCVDDMGSLSRVIDPEVVGAYERELLAKADAVFTTARGLQRRLSRWHRDVELVPNGSDPELYEDATRPQLSLPPELADVRGPVLGFSGVVDFRLDQELLADVMRRRPDWTLLVVGPVRTSVSTLAASRNVRFVGLQPQSSLPRYFRAMTVGLVPYVIGPMVQYIYPTKLNDYLGGGLPVISTPLPELEGWPDDLVARVSGAAALIDAVERLAPTRWDPDFIARRVAVARDNSWQKRADQIAARLHSLLRGARSCAS